MTSITQKYFFDETPPTSPQKTPTKKTLTEFFEELGSPTKVFPVKTNKGIKKISMKLSGEARDPGDVVYRFKQVSTGTKLVGSTSNALTRANKYLTSFRHPEKDIGKMALPKAVQENAKKAQRGKEKEDFNFGILFRKEDIPPNLQHLSIADLEKEYINYAKAKKTPLFNKRNGGGGGNAKAKNARPRATKEEVKAFVETLKKTYKSPAKTYSINKKTLKVELTPTVKKPSKNGHVYVLKRKKVRHLQKHEIVDLSRYVGKSERPKIANRMAEHSSHARHEEKDLGQKPLYRHIRKHPEQFEVQIINTAQFETDDLDLIESGLIQHYKEKSQTLYNKNSGGGGGHKRDVSAK